MKTTLGIVIGVIIGVIILVATLFLLFVLLILPATRQFSGEQTPTTVPLYSSPSTPAASTSSTVLPGETSLPAVNDVSFILNVTGVSGTDLSRTVSAEITNQGSIDAQNTRVKIEVFSNGSRVEINREEFLTKNLGTLGAGVPVTSEVSLSFSPIDGAKILLKGATFNLTIYSDQKTQNFSYDYNP
jgi:hypothetical protein